ncbi:MAG TPA: hypothetical protein VL361_22630 [Candidatus Limnocylindrales bacterium]|nr:hypothetical protein [Candidatus Limnocylindrales bacterium]
MKRAMVNDLNAPKTSREFLGLLQRRSCLIPTWRGWLLLLLGFIMLAVLARRCAYPFLALTKPVPGGVLVIEGWAQDDVLQVAVSEFRRNHYEKLYVTGGPLDYGSFLSEYRTFAERGAASLVKMGLGTNEVQAVPAPFARQDRTYTAAVALRDWWREHRLAPMKVHLLSEGPHARRSRLLYRQALGKKVDVGITAIESRNYDPRHWWRSSAGVRNVTDEWIAYLYVILFFRTRGE